MLKSLESRISSVCPNFSYFLDQVCQLMYSLLSKTIYKFPSFTLTHDDDDPLPIGINWNDADNQHILDTIFFKHFSTHIVNKSINFS